MQAIPHCTACHYYQLLFKTLFLITYYACLRAGEIVVSNDPSHVIQMSQIAVFERAGRKIYEINLTSFKHSKGRTPTLTLLPTATTQEFCPVTALDHYIQARGLSDGPLIRHRSGKPLTRTEFADFLHSCLVYCGEQDGKYGTHSFRVGQQNCLQTMSRTRLYAKRAVGKAMHTYSTFAKITSLSLNKH